MRTELVTDTAGFARLAPHWRRLERAPAVLGLFNGFDWQFEWWRALGGAGRSLRIVVARDGAEVTGLLPLYEEVESGARRLSLIGSPGGGSDYLDALATNERAREVMLGAATALGADLLELDDLDSASSTVSMLQQLARGRGARATVEPRYPCLFIPIRTDFQTYLKSVRRLENLRRREKWFAQQPGFRVVCETDPSAVAPFLARFFRLHAARWSVDGGSQAFSDPRLVAFHAAVASRLADRGQLRLWTMWVAGEAVAVAYAFESDNRSLYYQSGFHPAWGAKSAGLVLFARYVEDAFRRGLREVDLLRGAETYKTEWTRESRATATVRWALTARGRRALALRRVRDALRSGVRDALPAPLRLRLTRTIRAARMRAAA